MHIVWQDKTDIIGAGTEFDIFYAMYNPQVADNFVENTMTLVTEGLSVWPTDSSIALDFEENVHIIWRDQADYDGAEADSDIFYRHYNVSTNQQWSSIEVVSTESTAHSFMPEFAIDQDDSIH